MSHALRFASIPLLLVVGLAWGAPPRIANAAPYSDAAIERAAKKAKRLRGITGQLTSRRVNGRDNDTDGSALAQKKLIRKLKRISDPILGPGDEGFKQPFDFQGEVGTNLLGIIVGSELPNEYVVIGAHYDHLGTRSNASGRCSRGIAPGGEICNGATDNGTGSAAVIAVGTALKKLPRRPRRSIVLALWDAEEDGLVGSEFYVNNPAVPLAQTVTYINFDILGSDLVPTLASTTFAISPETGGPDFLAAVDAAYQPETDITPHKLGFIFGQLRSDYANFVSNGVPTVFYGDSTNACYHTTGDDRKRVNWKKAQAISRSAFRLAVEMAETDTPPTFVPPNPQLATFDDAIELDMVFTSALGDLARFPPADQATLEAIQQNITTIVSDGPGAFDATDIVALLNAAVDSLDLLTALDCESF